MLVKKLTLCNFRNFLNETIEFAPKINLFSGKNAQGKTNLLESLFFIATGRSFKTPHLAEAIHYGKDYFCLEVEIEKNSITEKIQIFYNEQEKRILHNGNVFTFFSHLLGIMPMVLFSFEDHTLFSGSPEDRRRFLNLHLAQMDPLYIYHFNRFNKAIKNRNALLRKDIHASSLDVWEEQMAKSAEYIYQKRKKLILEMENYFSFLQKENASNEIIRLVYKPSFLFEGQSYCGSLKKMRSKEQIIGHTLLGPHRDDCEIFLNNQNAKNFASEGQKRSCLLMLKLAEYLHLKDHLQMHPLFALDDIALHLDETREKKFQDFFSHLNQVIVTTPREMTFYEKALSTTLFSIENGQITRCIPQYSQ
jgi:DNA replication and repair protein RecF